MLIYIDTKRNSSMPKLLIRISVKDTISQNQYQYIESDLIKIAFSYIDKLQEYNGVIYESDIPFPLEADETLRISFYALFKTEQDISEYVKNVICKPPQ